MKGFLVFLLITLRLGAQTTVLLSGTQNLNGVNNVILGALQLPQSGGLTMFVQPMADPVQTSMEFCCSRTVKSAPQIQLFDVETSGPLMWFGFFNGFSADERITLPVAGTLVLGSWTHIALTWTVGGSMCVYVNAILRACRPLDSRAWWDTSTVVSYLGYDAYWQTFATGNIARVTLYRSPPSLAQIQADYLAGPAPATCTAGGSRIDPRRVAVIYNSNWTGDENGNGVQDSLELATYYAAQRAIPAVNVIGLPFHSPFAYTSWADVQNDFLVPLQRSLNTLGPLNIDVIAMMYQTPWQYQSPLAGTNYSLDSIAMSPFYSRDSVPLSNPYLKLDPAPDPARFSHTQFPLGIPSSQIPMYLVGRIDGASFSLAKAIIDSDIQVEASGVAQNAIAYVDDRAQSGPGVDSNGNYLPYTDAWLAGAGVWNYQSYESADEAIAWTEHYVTASKLPLKWERSPATIGSPGATFQDGTGALTAPNAFLYAGWYNLNSYKTAWQWIPGAVGNDLSSGSCGYNFRNPADTGWCVQAAIHGLNNVSGTTDEPGVAGASRPSILVWGLLHGLSLAESAAASYPMLGWMGITLGDPMYTPFSAH